jgi:general secretion pathway protein J
MKHRERGFTLLEILIALFIFTLLSFMLISALRTVINAESRAEAKALRLRQLQMTFLLMSRDIEQALDRPIINADGKTEAGFVGKKNGFQFTHTGFANTTGVARRSSLQRTGYLWNESVVYRRTWPVLDQAPETKEQRRPLLMNVTEAQFQYLDNEGHFKDKWPIDEANPSLPRGVRIHFTIAQWGKITQLYLIPVRQNEKDKQEEKK